MRGKTAKLIRKWAGRVWETTPEDQRKGFRNRRHFTQRIKVEWKRNNDFKKYVHHSLDTGLV